MISRRVLSVLVLTSLLYFLGACGSKGGGGTGGGDTPTPAVTRSRPSHDEMMRWTKEWLRRMQENPDIPPENLLPPPLTDWPGGGRPPQVDEWTLICTDGIVSNDPFPC